jgi:hypothetical protein
MAFTRASLSLLILFVSARLFVQLGNARGVERPPVGEPICCTATSAGVCDSMTAPTLSTSVALHVDWRSAGLSYAFAVTGGGRRE